MALVKRKALQEKEVGVADARAIVKTIKGEEVICGVIREYVPEKGQKVYYFTPYGKYGKAWLKTLPQYEPNSEDDEEVVFDD